MSSWLDKQTTCFSFCFKFTDTYSYNVRMAQDRIFVIDDQEDIFRHLCILLKNEK